MTTPPQGSPTTPVSSRRRRAMGTAQRLADRVLSVDGATTVSCVVGGAALDALAPGLSKAFDPQLLQGTVRHGFELAMARFRARRPRAVPSLSALAERLDAQGRVEALAAMSTIDAPHAVGPSAVSLTEPGFVDRPTSSAPNRVALRIG